MQPMLHSWCVFFAQTFLNLPFLCTFARNSRSINDRYGKMTKYRPIHLLFTFIFTLLLSFPMQAQTKGTGPLICGTDRFSAYRSYLKKPVALVVNQTSTMANGMHVVDYFAYYKANIKVIFAPEHGFRGKADAGEHVNDASDYRTGAPIISLYGKKRAPDSLDLAEVETVIFDIQDVGVRFYTYISTLQAVMEACARYHKTLVILDRPNPNGHYVDGPILEPAFKSFIGMQPIPIV
jgi:uncharacterized protein YbbC (DUF1343 family)